MERYNIDFSGMSKVFELAKSGRMRKIAKLWYSGMEIPDIAKTVGYAESVVVSEIVLINKFIENNISCKTCGQCGEKFYTGQKGTQICPICKEKNKKERCEQTKSVYKANLKSQTPKRKKFKSLKTIEKERAIYNKQHGTRLSYGQYVALVGE